MRLKSLFRGRPGKDSTPLESIEMMKSIMSRTDKGQLKKKKTWNNTYITENSS